MSLSDAVIGLKAYKEVDKRMEMFWQGLDQTLIHPRTNIEQGSIPAIQVENVRYAVHDLRILLIWNSQSWF